MEYAGNRSRSCALEAGVDEIIAEPVSEVGLGVAIMDRLRRAAAKAGSPTPTEELKQAPV